MSKLYFFLFAIIQRGLYGVPNVSKTLTNAVFVYLPLIYKCGTDLAKYLPDLLYIYVTFINVDPIYIYKYGADLYT